MKTSFHLKLMVSLAALGVLAQARPAQAVTKLPDPEASPLYAASMNNALADMLARDHTPTAQPQPEGGVRPGSIIAVEGTQWHVLPAPVPVSGPRPRDVTTEVTCGAPTCAAPTCAGTITCDYLPTCMLTGKTCHNYATCDGSSTCNGAPTCYLTSTCFGTPTCAGGPTCSSTCAGSPTCNGGSTCSGWATCIGTFSCSPSYTCGTASTCYGWPTCVGPSTCAYTCYGSPSCGGPSTCANTCDAAHCSPPLITGVHVPRPGQFQLGFSAYGGNVSYNVQFCTNLDAAQWTTVFSIPANNSTILFNHTNSAPRAYYRLSIQNL